MAGIAARAGLKFAVAFLLTAARATTGHPAEARLEAPAASASVPPQRIEQGGLALEFSLTPVSDNGSHQLIAGSDAIVRIRVTDGTSGEPLTGYRPKAWIVARRSGGQM